MSATTGVDARVPSVHVRAARGTTRAVALVLPGGRADSFDAGDPRHLSGRRMQPFARRLAREGAHLGLAVWTLSYRYRGWNGTEMSPVPDARWALAEVRARHGDVPVVLVGHSMGGRTAIRVAGEPAVRGAVALAPWLPDGEPVAQLAGRRLLVVHGSRDRVTSPRASRRFCAAAAQVADEASYVLLRGEAHAMLLRWPVWHRLATTAALDFLGLGEAPAGNTAHGI